MLILFYVGLDVLAVPKKVVAFEKRLKLNLAQNVRYHIFADR